MKWELCLLLSEMRADQQESVTTHKLETYLALMRMRDFNDYLLWSRQRPFNWVSRAIRFSEILQSPSGTNGAVLLSLNHDSLLSVRQVLYTGTARLVAGVTHILRMTRPVYLKMIQSRGLWWIYSHNTCMIDSNDHNSENISCVEWLSLMSDFQCM